MTSAALPSKINLLCGEWALAKMKNGSNPVDLAPVADIMKDNRWKKVADYRWGVESDGKGDDAVIIFSARGRPRRCLRAGIPIMLESVSSSKSVSSRNLLRGASISSRSRNHSWYIECPEDAGPDALANCESFYIRSVQSGMYLTVEAGQATLQKDAPDVRWDWSDATNHSTMTLRRLSHQRPEQKKKPPAAPAPPSKPQPAAAPTTIIDLDALDDMPIPSELDGMNRFMSGAPSAAPSARSYGETAAASGSEGEEEEEEEQEDNVVEEDPDLDMLRLFEGSMVDAFEKIPELPEVAPKTFTPAGQLLGDCLELCNDESFLPPGCSMGLDRFYLVLFGPVSNFQKRYQARRKTQSADWDVPGPLAVAPWAGVATVRCQVPVPVLGLRPCVEVFRVVMSRERDGGMTTLAMQSVSKVLAGRFGEFRSEMLSIWTQADSTAPVRMRTVALTPKGSFAGRAVEGHKQALADWKAAALEVLSEVRS